MTQPIINVQQTAQQLQDHLRMLTQTIGERSIRRPENIERAADYIELFFRDIDVPVHRQPYRFWKLNVANIVAEISFCPNPSKHYIVGAHYDSVSGTVGADDNASSVAVLLELGRHLKALQDHQTLDLAVKLVAFALEEPPVFSTRHMGSRVYAAKAKKAKEKIDGMLCLEMVGYACHYPGCQKYPLPLFFRNYPKQGDFIGIVGNFRSRKLTSALWRAFQKNAELPVMKLTVPLGGWILPAVRLSDHASFWSRGYKAVMITDSAFYRNPHYHRRSDTMEKLDYRFMAELVESLLIFFSDHLR